MFHGIVLLSAPLAVLAVLLYLNAYLHREPADAGECPRRRRTDV
ncbi:hypothetical protein [Actinoplanes sp. NPDC049681]